MNRIILSLTLNDVPKVRIVTAIAMLKTLGIEVEQARFVARYKDKETLLLEYILENIIEKQLEIQGFEATSERVDYIVNDLIKGNKFNEPFVDMLGNYVSNAVVDRRIELNELERNKA